MWQALPAADLRECLARLDQTFRRLPSDRPPAPPLCLGPKRDALFVPQTKSASRVGPGPSPPVPFSRPCACIWYLRCHLYTHFAFMAYNRVRYGWALNERLIRYILKGACNHDSKLSVRIKSWLRYGCPTQQDQFLYTGTSSVCNLKRAYCRGLARFQCNLF